MNLQQLHALAPLLTLSVTICVVLMLIAFWRNHRLACGASVLGLGVSLLAVGWSSDYVPIAVTPLLEIDQFALLMAALVLITSMGVALLAFDYFELHEKRPEEFQLLLLLSALGALVLVASRHFASFLLGLELLSISLYALISYPTRGRITLEAALKYLILSGVASSVMLMGAALVYAGLGTLEFEQLASGFFPPQPETAYYVSAGSALLLAGLAFKLSLVPFHMWTPDVYEGAPAPVTAFVATVSKGAIFAVMVRFFVLTGAFRFEAVQVGLSVFAIGSMLAGNLLALQQQNVKRILAYSSIAHLGYLMVAFISGAMAEGMPLAIEASSFYLVAYMVTSLGAFGCVTILSESKAERDVDDINSYTGLFWRRPALAGAFTLVLLSLAGIPLTAGFVGKFYVVAAGVGGMLWLLLGTLVVGSGIGLYYYLRLIYAMTLRGQEGKPVAIPVAGGWVMLSVSAAILCLGVYPAPLIELLDSVVRSLLMT